MDQAGAAFLLQLMEIGPRDRILELECGEGEFSVALAAGASEGLVAGLDRDEERMRRARVRARETSNAMFMRAGAGEIPWQENSFSKALSHGMPADLSDVLRVLAPGARLFVLLERPADQAGDPSSGLARAGFTEIRTRSLPDDTGLVLSAMKPTLA